MNTPDRRLDRLFRSASQASPATEEQLPHHVEKGILSHWRLMRIPVESVWATECFVPALALSVAVLLGVQVWHVLQPTPGLTDHQFTLIALYKLWNL